ncbi:hypothetical protein H5V45_14670 [Nocardioides sp. KIGAM211]|uniref:Uncharacterized protein n=1 Tax=Nocardioides luti TaxID=2761101 RepID=A0A7X0RHU8_9ACTN|nr:hypothetical protein [Nocardioides luti]MBB6628566.1 hypothetical protein [Nocardioides luti]
MDLHTVARGSGLLGGLCWVVRLVLDLAGSGTGGAADGLYWVGLVLLAVGLAGMGAGLVSTSATWLQAIVAVAFPLLVWSVLEVLHPAGNPRVIDGVLGLVVAGAAVQRLLRDRRRREARRRAGAHAR